MTTVRVAIVAVAVLGGCAFSPGAQQPSGTGGHAGINITGTGGGASQGPCQGLQCQQSTCKKGSCVQPACTGGVVTTATGKVLRSGRQGPAAPTSTSSSRTRRSRRLHRRPGLRHLRDGAVGRAGGAERRPTPTGNFTLGDASADVPVGQQHPAGDPGRPLAAPGDDRNVAGCADTPVAADMTRLPRNQSEGHLPEDRADDRAAPTRSNACCARSASPIPSSRPSRAAGGSTSSRASTARTSSTRRWAAPASRRSRPGGTTSTTCASTT